MFELKLVGSHVCSKNAAGSSRTPDCSEEAQQFTAAAKSVFKGLS